MENKSRWCESPPWWCHDNVGIHTLTWCTHIFLHSACTVTFCTFLMRCHIHAWLKGAKKVLCTCVVSLYLAFSSLMSHPSLLFLHGHFEPTFPSAPFLPYFLVLKAQGMRNSARGREVWLSGQVRPHHRLWAQRVRQDHTCGQWHDTHWRSRPQLKSLTSRNTHEKIGLFDVLTMFESSVSHVSHDLALQIKEIMQSGNRCQTEREKFLWSVLQSRCQRKVNGTVLVWVWRVTEKSFSDGWVLREHLQRRTRQAITGESPVQKNNIWMGTRWRSRIWSEEIQNTHWLSRSVSMNLNDNKKQPVRASSTWENTFVKRIEDEGPSSSRKLCKKLPRNWRIEKDAAIKRKILKNNEDWKNVLWSMIRNHEQWVYWMISDEDYKNDWNLL